MINLPEAYINRMRSMLGAAFSDFIESYNAAPVRGMRINTLKISKDDFLALCPFKVEQAETLNEGLILSENVEHIGTNPLHIAGLFYMQEPSAMSVIEQADIRENMRVLDLCAAPGGKSGGIASRLNGTGILVSNEIVPSRAKLLAQNLERLGIMNAVTTSAHPDAVADALPEYFDRVIVDAPCSGEGMFRKDAEAILEWTPEHVKACALRQSSILESAVKNVAYGGKLIYSTCTFSYEENEEVIERFLTKHPDFSLEYSKRLFPHTVKGEGHFVARLKRSGIPDCGTAPSSPFRCAIDKKTLCLVTDFLSETFLSFPSSKTGSIHLTKDNRALYLPFEIDEAIKKLRIITMGIEIGEAVKGRIKPAHALFMAAGNRTRLNFEAREKIELYENNVEMRQFLSGNTLEIKSSLRGFIPVCVKGLAVGFGKAVDGTLKNHLPKGLTVKSFR